jgi:cytochrome c biogenesis protein ResB
VRRLWAAAVSLRTTALLLAAIAALLLSSVLLPQRSHDPRAYAAAIRSGGAASFVLETLGLGSVATSGMFLATLALFMANLAAVLVDRTGATLRRIRFAIPTAAQLQALRAGQSVAEVEAPGLSLEEAASLLAASGYRTARVGDGLWGIKHRLAILGFPLFHASFFVLSAGALQLYLSRNVVNVVAAEGQTVLSSEGSVVRRAPGDPALDFAVRVDRVDVRLERGFPVDLSAQVAIEGGGAAQLARVNQPATWGDLTVLVDRAGIAPVLWVVDGRGYTRDRVVVAAANVGGLPTRLTLGSTAIEAVVEQVAVGKDFPERSALPRAPIQLRLRSGGATAFDGALRPGQSVRVGDLSVGLEEVRYWVGLRLVRERGGGLLILGFVLAVVGIVWRMVWTRREVALTWSGDRIGVAVRGEFFASKAREECEDLARLLVHHGGRQVGGKGT